MLNCQQLCCHPERGAEASGGIRRPPVLVLQTFPQVRCQLQDSLEAGLGSCCSMALVSVWIRGRWLTIVTENERHPAYPVGHTGDHAFYLDSHPRARAGLFIQVRVQIVTFHLLVCS